MPRPKVKTTGSPKSSVAPLSGKTTKVGELDIDPRYDPRVKEQERISGLTTTIEPRLTQDIPQVSLVDFEGYPFITSMADRTAAGGTLTGINDVALKRPINLQGGQDYMFENPGQVWASGENPVRQLMLGANAMKAITGKDPLYMPWRMAPTGSDFAHMTGETMLSFAESNMGSKAKRSLDKQIRAFIPDWKGIDNPDSFNQYRELPDVARKALKNIMDVNFREEGGLGIGEARLAIADPRQVNAPESHIMNVGRIFADQPIIQESGHVSYPRGVPGEGIGIIDQPRSVFELLPEYAKERGIPDPSNPRQTDIRSMQMKPYMGIITNELLKEMGYADGGMVDSAPEEAIKNTIRDPQAFKMLDMDLANLALMSQPRQMANGGAVNMDEGGLLQNAFRAFVPAQVRTFVGSLAGDESPITEKNFSSEELAQMRDAIMSSRRDRTATNARLHHEAMQNAPTAKERRELFNRGPSKELDQTVGYQHYSGSPTDLASDFSLSRDAAIRNTLGRFAYEKTPEGNLVATDLYKFRNDQSDKTRPTSDYADMGTARKLGTLAYDTLFGDAGFQTLPSRMGNAFLGNKPGRPVTVNLGKAPFAEGGEVKPPAIFEQAQVPFEEVRRQLGMKDGGDAGSGIDINRLYSPFSVLEKPTYGSEIPGAPTIDQQRYELTARGQQEEENRARRSKDHLTAVDPAGTLGVSDVLTTLGKGIVAAPAYIAGNIYDWLRNNKVSDEGAKARGQAIEEWMQPKTQEGAEFLETLGEIPEKITGATMGFGLHPNLWVTGAGMPTPAQMRAGLRLGAERAAPIAGKIDQAVRSGYESGAIPQPGMSIKDVTPRVLAPANEQGFYSPTEAAALNLQRKSGSGQAFLNDLLKQENVRPDEINAMGLDTFLKDKKNITAAEVQDFIANNKIQLGESTYRDQPKITPEQKIRLNELQRTNYDRMYPEEFDAINGAGSYEELMRLQNARDGFSAERLEYEASRMAREARKYQTLGNINGDKLSSQYRYKADHLSRRADLAASEVVQPKYKQYQLPGGENYREVVITMPPANKYKVEPIEGTNRWKVVDENGELYKSYYDKDDATRAAASYNRDAGSYKSSHWSDPNPLAHLRMSDRVTDGKKTLLVDEVQSDWHQEGREKGYKGGTVERAKDYRWDQSAQETLGIKENDPAWVAKDRNGNVVGHYTSEGAAKTRLAEATNGVPDAPFKDDWYQLALKRAIKEAIDNGYDRVALPTGARVSERFDLSKQIDRIDYNKNDDGTYSMSAIKGGKEVFSKQGLDEKELSGLVGKDVAKKIVGDEGAAQYDVELADELGVGVVKSLTGLDLSVGGKGMRKYYDEVYPAYLKKFGKRYGSTVGTTTVDVDGKPEPLHYMEITPAMREAFKTGIHMKRGGKVSFANDIDAMRLALSKG